MKLSKEDARRALVRHHFTPCETPMDAFHRLRSIQFDPIAPVGCNHDLVLQARVQGYQVGDWEELAYSDRLIYDGWDKQASLVPFEGWPLRRYIHKVHRRKFEKKIFEDYKEAVELILKEIGDRGPLMPKECEFQERREDWKSSWHGAGVTKQALRALWHSGLVMTTGRKNGQHLYDLTERVVPNHLFNQPVIDDKESLCGLALERHRAAGIVRPNASAELWSYAVLFYDREKALPPLVDTGKIVPVDVEGVKAHATPEFLSLLDMPPPEGRVVFVAPLDQFLWDRKLIQHVFGFDYVWEIYMPEAKRRWGYYVLPILFGDQLVARAEFWCRAGVLEVREWHFEQVDLAPSFWPALERAIVGFMRYCSASAATVRDQIDPRVRDLFREFSLV